MTTSVDPRTGEAFGPDRPDTADLEPLLAAAAAAAGPWARTPAADREAALVAVADALDAAAGDLVALTEREAGLDRPRLTGELARATYQIRSLARAATARLGRRTEDGPVPGPPPQGRPRLVRAEFPLGPVAVFGAVNFPYAYGVLGGDTASALAAGCPVVAKAHPGHPGTCVLLVEIAGRALAAAGAPPGTLSLVHGLAAGSALVADRRIAAVGFTGSRAGGRALFDVAAARQEPIPFHGELGSINPVAATPEGAAADGFVTGYLDSLLLGGGQFCTNPSVLLVPEDEALLGRLAAAVAERPAALLAGADVRRRLVAGRDALAGAPGVRSLARGGPTPATGAWASPELLTVPADRAPDAVLHEEVFGPVGVVVTYRDEAEAVGVLERMHPGLAGAVHGSPDEPLATRLLDELAARCGRVVWNGWPTGVAVSPAMTHGGPYPAGTSALHTSVGDHALDRFLRPVTFQSLPDELLPPASPVRRPATPT
jgi:NADP-dependent aldehyde dehydrogenase